MTGGLFDPIGTDRTDPRPAGWHRSAPVVVAAVLVLALATLLGVAWLRDDGDRGRPTAVATIDHARLPPKPPATDPVPPAAAEMPQAAATVPPAPTVSAGLPPARADQEVEIQNGVRIIRPRRDAPAQTGQTIRVPDAKVAR